MTPRSDANLSPAVSSGNTVDEPACPPLHGLLAEYDSSTALVHAAERIRDSGLKQWESFSPFPVHGIEQAEGIKPTRLPWLAFSAGVLGCAVGTLLQWWTNAFDYPFIISGKPFFGWPESLPITFEITLLFAAVATVLGMLVLNDLPKLSSPLDRSERFQRATDDRFFVVIRASDPQFDLHRTALLLAETQPRGVEAVFQDCSSPERLPPGIRYGALVLGVALVVPFPLIALQREIRSPLPRVHLVPDMDFQTYLKPQREFRFFDDLRAGRPEIAGTVALGDLKSEALMLGKADGNLVRTFLREIQISASTMRRGQQQFDVFCAPCHGLGGKGDGMVAARADALAEGTWIPPTDLTQDYLHDQAVGQLFDSISQGIRNMPALGPQIPAEDRWAIVLYLRALQRHQSATLQDVPEAERRILE